MYLQPKLISQPNSGIEPVFLGEVNWVEQIIAQIVTCYRGIIYVGKKVFQI